MREKWVSFFKINATLMSHICDFIKAYFAYLKKGGGEREMDFTTKLVNTLKKKCLLSVQILLEASVGVINLSPGLRRSALWVSKKKHPQDNKDL